MASILSIEREEKGTFKRGMRLDLQDFKPKDLYLLWYCFLLVKGMIKNYFDTDMLIRGIYHTKYHTH